MGSDQLVGATASEVVIQPGRRGRSAGPLAVFAAETLGPLLVGAGVGVWAAEGGELVLDEG